MGLRSQVAASRRRGHRPWLVRRLSGHWPQGLYTAWRPYIPSRPRARPSWPRRADRRGVGGGVFPPDDVKWISLPGSQELALCVAHCLPDPTGIFSNAHNELGYAAPSFDWADESQPPKAQPEFPTRIAAVRRAFAIGKWDHARVTEAWVSLGSTGPCVRAYGIGFKQAGRLRAAKAALAVHVHIALGSDKLGPLWYLQALEDQCLRMLQYGVEEC